MYGLIYSKSMDLPGGIGWCIKLSLSSALLRVCASLHPIYICLVDFVILLLFPFFLSFVAFMFFLFILILSLLLLYSSHINR